MSEMETPGGAVCGIVVCGCAEGLMRMESEAHNIIGYYRALHGK